MFDKLSISFVVQDILLILFWNLTDFVCLFLTTPHSKQIIHADWLLFFSKIFLFTILRTLIGSVYTAFLTYNHYGITDNKLAN